MPIPYVGWIQQVGLAKIARGDKYIPGFLDQWGWWKLK
jgi:hypothetical protein